MAYITLFVDKILNISKQNSYLLWFSKTAVLLNILILLSYIAIYLKNLANFLHAF